MADKADMTLEDFNDQELAAIEREEIRRREELLKLEAKEAGDSADPLSIAFKAEGVAPQGQREEEDDPLARAFKEEAQQEKEDPGFLDYVSATAEAAPEAIERFMSGQSVGEPFAEKYAEEDIPYVSPLGVLGKGISAITAPFSDEETPEIEAYVDEPRKKRIEFLKQPLLNKDTWEVNIEALEASDLPETVQNEIMIKSISKRTNIPTKIVRNLVNTRLGHTKNDGVHFDALKAFGRIIDAGLWNVPSAIAAKGYKEMVNFDQYLQRPKGYDMLGPEGAELFARKLPEIRSGKIDELQFGGLSVDVSPSDEIDDVQDKLYKEWVDETIGLAEETAFTSGTDMASMLIPVGQVGMVAKGLKGASAASRASRAVSKFVRKASPASLKGTKIAVVTDNAARKLNNTLGKAVNHPISEGIYLVTENAALNALGAPAGREKEAAAATVLMMGSPMAMASGVKMLSAPTVKQYDQLATMVDSKKNNKLYKKIQNSESFDQLPRWHKNRLKHFYGDDALSAYEMIKRETTPKGAAFAMTGSKDPKVLNDFSKTMADLKKQIRENGQQGAYELFKAELASPDSEIRRIVDNYLIANPERKSVVETVIDEVLADLMSKTQNQISMATEALRQGSITKEAFNEVKSRVEDRYGSYRKLYNQIDKKETRTSLDDFFKYIDSDNTYKHLSSEIRRNLSNEDLINEYARTAMLDLVAHYPLQKVSLENAARLVENGQLMLTGRDGAAIAQHINRHRTALKKNKFDSVDVKATSREIFNDVDGFMKSIDEAKTKLEEIDAPSELKNKNAALRRLTRLETESSRLAKRSDVLRVKQEKSLSKVQGILNKLVDPLFDETVPKGALESIVDSIKTYETVNILDMEDLRRFIDNNPESAVIGDVARLVKHLESYRETSARLRNVVSRSRDLAIQASKERYFMIESQIPEKMQDELAQMFGGKKRASVDEIRRGIAKDVPAFVKKYNNNSDNVVTLLFMDGGEQIFEKVADAFANNKFIDSSVWKWFDDLKDPAIDTPEVRAQWGGLKRGELAQISSEVSYAIKAGEDFTIKSQYYLRRMEEFITEQSQNLPEMLMIMKKLKERYKYKLTVTKIKELDERFGKLFVEGADLPESMTPKQRKKFYNFLNSAFSERMYYLVDPSWLVSHKESAFRLFKVKNMFTNELLETMNKVYNKAYGEELDVPSFVSMFFRPTGFYDISATTHKIALLSLARRQMTPEAVKGLEAQFSQSLVSALEDSTLMSIAQDERDYSIERQRAMKEARTWTVKNFYQKLDRVRYGKLQHKSQVGTSLFDDMVKKAFGVKGMKQFIAEVDTKTGRAGFTQFGAILRDFYMVNRGEDLDKVFDKHIPKWREGKNAATYKEWHENILTYWGEFKQRASEDHWGLLFETYKTMLEADYQKINYLNKLIEDVNERYGVTQPLMPFEKNRVMVEKLIPSTFKTLWSNNESSRTFSDQIFGRHIGTTLEGQLRKLDDVTLDNVKLPQETFVDDTMRLFEAELTFTPRKRLQSTALMLNDAGYLAQSSVLQKRFVEQQVSDIQVSNFRKAAWQAIGTLPMGNLMQLAILTLRPALSARTVLSNPVNLMRQNAQATAFSVAASLGAGNVKGVTRATAAGAQGARAIIIGSGQVIPSTMKMLVSPFNPQAKNSPVSPSSPMGEQYVARYVQGDVKSELAIPNEQLFQIVNSLTENDINTAMAASFNTYRMLPTVEDTLGLKSAITAINSKSDLIIDNINDHLKERMELSFTRQHIVSGMNQFETAYLAAQDGASVEGVASILYQPMRELTSRATVDRVASQIYMSVQRGEDVPLQAASVYATFYKDFMVSRFDSANLPPWLQQIGKVIPGASEFANAKFMTFNRMFTAMSRAFGQYNLNKPNKTHFAALMAAIGGMSIGFDVIENGYGGEDGWEGMGWPTARLSPMPIIGTAFRQATGGEVKPWEDVTRALFSPEMRLGGMQYNMFSRLLMKAFDSIQGFAGDDPADHIAGEVALREALDTALQLTPLSPLTALIDKPSMAIYMWSDSASDPVLMDAAARGLDLGIEMNWINDFFAAQEEGANLQSSELLRRNLLMLRQSGMVPLADFYDKLLQNHKRKELKLEQLEKDFDMDPGLFKLELLKARQAGKAAYINGLIED